MNDETVMIPVIPNDVMADKMKPPTESDRYTEARNRGITIGMGIALGLLAMCCLGIAFGSLLTRWLGI